MCYHVCGMVHIKEPLLLIGRSSLCGSSGFPFSLSEWSFTICLDILPLYSKGSAFSLQLHGIRPSYGPLKIMGYSFNLQQVIFYVHHLTSEDSTHHSLCDTSCEPLAEIIIFRGFSSILILSSILKFKYDLK